MGLLHSFSSSSPTRLVLHLSYRKKKRKKTSFRSTLHSDLPPTFILLHCLWKPPVPWVWVVGLAEHPSKEGQQLGALHRRLEVMSKQVIIMRWALQKLTRFSRRSVTHSRASRYSRESSSKTCSKSTAKTKKLDGKGGQEARMTSYPLNPAQSPLDPDLDQSLEVWDLGPSIPWLQWTLR